MGIQFTGLASGLDTNAIVSDLMKVERMQVERIEKQKALAEVKKEAWTEMNTKLYSFYKDALYKFKSASTYNQKNAISSNENVVSVSSASGAVNGSHEITVNQMAKGSMLTGAELTTDINSAEITASTTAGELISFADPNVPVTLSVSLDGGTTTHDISVESTDTIANIMSKFEELDLDMNISFDDNFNRVFASSKDTGSGVQIQFDGDDTLLTALGFASGSRTGSLGENAEFTYNGADFVSENNELTINGLSVVIKSDTGTSSISVTQDVDSVYDAIKSFITEYNELLDTIQEKYGAESARDYEPLTDEEKQAMTENDIELWENKIKDSILRRDDNLFAVSSSMRNIMTIQSGVDTTGFTYTSITQLGIITGDYSERGKLHIEGDADDAFFGAKDDKLRAAIEEDPDAVLELMTAIGTTLYDDINDRMKSSSISSAFSFYSDKALQNEIDRYDLEIFEMEDRLVDVENRYYKQFTAMEQAMQQSNSTMEWLTQQLGGM